MGIEYDGLRFHKDKTDKDTKQIYDLELDNIKLIRVREKPLPKLGLNDVHVFANKLMAHDDIAVLLRQILKIKLKNFSPQIVEDCQNYINNGIFVAEDEYVDTVINRFSVPFEQSLKAKFPEIAVDWDLEKNHPYTPDIITPGVVGNASGELFYWICPVDPKHPSYPMAVYSRTGKLKSGCPYCSGRYATHDNSLELKHPEHAKMFDRAENFSKIGDQLFASMIKPNSGVTYNWVCPNEHDAFSISPDVLLRKKEYLGCPSCRKVAIAEGTHKFNNEKFDQNEIIALFQQELAYEKISEQVGCSTGQVGNIILKFKRVNDIKVQSRVTDAIFCKELNRHFLSHFDAKKELLKLGYQHGNILSVLRGDCKTTGGLSFSYSDLDNDQIKNQNPANFVELSFQKPSNSRQEIYCVELE